MRSSRRSAGFPGKLLASVLLGAVASAASASVLIPFPFTADFEAASGYTVGPLVSDPVWTLPPGLSAEVTPPGFEGEQSLAFLGDAWLGLSPDPASVANGYPITWVDFYVRAAYAPLSELSTWANNSHAAATGFVRTATTGEIFAMDGTGDGTGVWLPTGKTTALEDERPASWQRLSYRIDYQHRRWDLYVDGQLTLIDLGFFNHAATSFTSFGLKGAATKASFLDYFYAGDLNPLYADADNDGLPDAWLQTHGLVGADADRYADPDRDGVNNVTEFLLGLAPANPDTDDDGVYDGRELARGTDPLLAEARSLSAFPFADSFETDVRGAFIDGTRQWSVAFGESPSSLAVVATPASGADGLNALSFAGRDPSLEREFAATGAQLVWLDFRADLAPRAQPAPVVPKDAAALFYLSATGDLMAFDGSGIGGGAWVPVAQLPAAPASPPAFHRYTLRLDYAAQRWSLWLDNVLVRSDLGFANAVPYFSGFKLDHEAMKDRRSAGFDAFAATTAESAGLDNDDDGLSNEEERAFGSNLHLADTDGDGIWDKTERDLGTDPLQANGIAAQLVADASGAYTWQTRFSAVEGYAAGYLAGQQGWVAVGESVVADESSRLSATTTDALVEHYFGTRSIDRVWIRFRAKLAPGEMPGSAEVSGPVSGMFGWRSANKLAVFDAATFAWVEHPMAVVANDWNDYVLFFDYSAKRWLLALNGRLIAHDLPFRDAGLSHLARLRVLQQGAETATEPKQAEIDDILVSNVPFAGLDLDGDGLLDSDERIRGTDPFSADTDGDGMPDKWEVDNGLNPVSAADALADKDQDGFANFVEFQHGADPSSVNTALAGKVHWDEWTGLSGSLVKDLTANARFPNQPSSRALLGTLELPTGRGTNYGTRLRAWLLPPVSGDYTFWIAGDDDAELWLSSDENPFDRQLIARNGGYTASREWEKHPEMQRSALLSLVAGQRYYIEVLHKQGTGGENVAVAWQIPGTARALIDTTYLEAFPRFADDQDEDGLPDSWEIANGLSAISGAGRDGYYGDFDRDGFSNHEEFVLGLKPNAIDSDGDGVSDFGETELGSDPTNPSSSAVLGPPAPWLVGGIGGKTFQWVAQAEGKVVLWTNSTAFASRSDSGGILYQNVTGNFTCDGAVWFDSTTRADVEGGLMIRDSLAADAPFVAITRDGDAGWLVRHRAVRAGRVLAVNLAGGTPINHTQFAIGRVGSVVSLYGRVVGGVLRKLADYPVTFSSGTAAVGYVAWSESSSLPGSLVFSVGAVRQDSEAADMIGEPGLSAFDSVAWMGEWDGLITPVLGGAEPVRQPRLDELLSRGATLETVASVPGASASSCLGDWSVSGASLAADDRRGEIEVPIQLSRAASPLLEIVVGEAETAKTQSSHFPIKVFVDGLYLGTRTLTAEPGTTASGLWFAPWLEAGPHTVRLVWDGAADYTRLRLDRVVVREVQGVDNDGNSRPDWVERRLHLFNGLDVADRLESSVNPAPVEGRSRWPETVSLSVDGGALAVEAGAGYRWFSRVPLSRDHNSVLAFEAENRGVRRAVEARWVPQNALVPGALSVAVGSRVLFEVSTDGTDAFMSLAKDGVPVALAAGRAEILFAQPGVFRVAGRAESQAGVIAAETTVTVFAPPALPSLLPGLIKRERIISRPALAAGVVLEADPRVGLVVPPSNSAQIGWQADDNMVRSLVARAGADGPVLGRVSLPGTELFSTLDTYTRIVATHPDGSKETETLVIMSPVRSDHAIRLEIFVAGVVFDDGTRTKTLWPSDMDELGQARVRIIRPPDATTSVCHRTHLVHLNTVIGTK